MILSKEIYSPQNYLEKMTDKVFVFDSTIDSDIEFVENVLIDNIGNNSVWSHPLSEIDNIIEEDVDVVLVECNVWNEEIAQYEKVYRWFEADRELEW